VLPILRHLLSNDSGALFGDEILARVRAMLSNLARALLDRVAEQGPGPAHDPLRLHVLSEAILATPALLAHLHAQALEWALTERLEARWGIDPVVPPLLHAWIGISERTLQALATRLLAAQAKWCQAQRRMEVSLDELPGEALHAALLTLRGASPNDAQVERADAAIRDGYDEGATRLGLAARLVTELGEEAGAALEVEQAGSALFITALSLYSGEARDCVIMAMQEIQPLRLGLVMQAAGLAPLAVERQMAMLNSQTQLVPGLAVIGPEQAAEILRDTRRNGA
jgi:hypothetical protein